MMVQGKHSTRRRMVPSVLVRKCVVQPGARHLPMPFHGGRRTAQRLGGFLDGQPTEIAQLDDPGLLGVEPFQCIEGAIQGRDVDATVFAIRQVKAGDGHPLAPIALVRRTPARVVDQHLAHHPRRHVDEVHPVLPFDAFKAAEPHVGLVDQRRRLQGMARTLTPELPLRDRAQFGVNRINQPVTRSQVTLPPCGKPRRELSVHGFESSSAPTHCARGQAAPLLLRSPRAMIAGRQGDSA